MRSELAGLIRTGREARGWDQARLAHVLAVGQQTVSRWERGETKPRGEQLERLCSLLGLDSSSGTVPTKRPLLEELPFNQLDPYRFEEFSAALLSRIHPDPAQVDRYGVSGDAQSGIDVRVVAADGRRIGVQCKRYRTFQPASFHKAVKAFDAAGAKVDRCILFLSTRATRKVMDACDAANGWEIWDSQTLSRKVYELPQSEAVALVDRFFPGLREEFLGVAAPSVWQTADEAYAAAWHDLPLVGRAGLVEEMLSFASPQETAGTGSVAALTGTAGLGKSRLLLELTRRYSSRVGDTVRVLLPGPLPLDAFELLPDGGPLLVVIDDAHDRTDDLPAVLSGVLRTRPQARVLLALRPYGAPVLRESLRRCGLDESSVRQWSLAPLAVGEARQLAEEVLGPGHALATRYLGSITADSPLLLVRTAEAVRDGHLSLPRLQADPHVRKLLLETLAASALAGSPQPDADRALLCAVAAVQPVDTGVQYFRDALEKLLDVPFSTLHAQVQRLEQQGVLLRRGSLIRITPDLLGDALLAQAAVEPRDGSSTGYLDRVREHAEGSALVNAFVNAGRVDGQWNGEFPHRRGVFDALWEGLRTEFEESSVQGRSGLLHLLARIAPFQSRRVLQLVEWALDHPEQPGGRSERAQLTRLLEAVAADLDLLRSVYDHLWDLGRDDRGPLHNEPSAPLRVLQDIASYAPGKPLDYQQILLDAMPEWLAERAPRAGDGMPLALLGRLYSDTAESATFEGVTLTLGRHRVSVEVVAPIRRRATEILLGEFAAEEEARAVAAAMTVEEALRCPAPEFAASNAEFLHAVARVAKQVRPGPYQALALRRSLNWTARHGNEPLRSVARDIIDTLPNTPEHRLALHVNTDDFDVTHVDFAIADGDPEHYEEALTAWAKKRQELARELAALPLDQAADLLIGSAQRTERLFAAPAAGAGAVAAEAVKAHPALAAPLVERLERADDATSLLMLRQIIHEQLATDPAAALKACRGLLSSGNAAAVAAAAQAYQFRIQEAAVRDAGAVDLLRTFSRHSDRSVRVSATEAAAALLSTDREAALDILTAAPAMSTQGCSHRLWAAFDNGGPLDWRILTQPQRAHFFQEITAAPDLEGYPLQQALAKLAVVDGTALAALLCARVERWENMLSEGARAGSYDPLPMRPGTDWRIPPGAERLKALRNVRDWLVRPRPDSWRREHEAPELFWALAGDADTAVLDVILEPYRQGAAEAAQAVAPLLRRVPRSTIWERVELMDELLRLAERLPKATIERTLSSLHAAVFDGVRSGTAGRPFPEDVAIREQVRAIRVGLPRGSRADRFYRMLEESAQGHIEWQRSQSWDET